LAASPASRWLISVFGDQRLGGRWRVPDRLNLLAVLGDVTVDLRQAEVCGDELSIQASALFGSVRVIVPRGMTVQMSGLAVFGDKELCVGPADEALPSPSVRVRASAIFGNVVVTDQPPKSLMQSMRGRWKKRRGLLAEQPQGSAIDAQEHRGAQG
jgi:hypothetical protein